MRFNSSFRGWSAVLALTVAMPSVLADEIFVKSNSVIPIVMDDELSFKDSREGDRFFATVEDGRDLPSRSRLEGRIINIERKNGDRPAYMDVEFDTLLLPDGGSQRIRAVPISLDSKYVTRDRDGRLTAKKGAVRRDHYVWGGVIGGAILGSIIGRKTFEGAFVGAIAGIIMAETSSKDEEVALKRGTKMGALFEKDLRVEYAGRWDRYQANDPRNGDQRGSDPYYRRGDQYEYENSAPVRIEFEGRDLRFSAAEKPFRNGETVMVPLERTAGQMGIDVQINGRTILLEDEETMVKLEQDSSAYRLNGKRGQLPREIVKRGSTVYVPLEILATMKRQSVYVNGDKVKNISS